MKLKPTGKRVVNEGPASRFGLYLWRMPNGSYVANEDKDFLSIAAERGDPIRMQILRNTVRSFGITEGQPVFFPGLRKISDEEYEVQRERMRLGLVPDTEDIGSLIDDIKGRKND